MIALPTYFIIADCFLLAFTGSSEEDSNGVFVIIVARRLGSKAEVASSRNANTVQTLIFVVCCL